MMGSQPWENHTIPPNLTAELFPGLTYEEALADQETLYEALKIIASDQAAIAPGDERGTQQGRNLQSQSLEEPYLSGNIDSDSQLALDEAMARSLQELEDGIVNVSITNAAHNATSVRGNEENTSENVSANASGNSSENAGGSSSNAGPDEADALPGMTYEEMLELGEAIGTQSRGLSKKAINSLPSFKYKSGFFSRKSKAGQCSICISEFQHKQYLTTLPCCHQYHKECITRWLKENKSCPVCQSEVKLSS